MKRNINWLVCFLFLGFLFGCDSGPDMVVSKENPNVKSPAIETSELAFAMQNAEPKILVPDLKKAHYLKFPCKLYPKALTGNMEVIIKSPIGSEYIELIPDKKENFFWVAPTEKAKSVGAKMDPFYTYIPIYSSFSFQIENQEIYGVSNKSPSISVTGSFKVSLNEFGKEVKKILLSRNFESTSNLLVESGYFDAVVFYSENNKTWTLLHTF